MLTVKRLRQVLSYDPDTGTWTWLVSTGRRVRVGGRAGAKKKRRGYWRIGIDGKYYASARLAYMTGQWPPHLVDHIDRDPAIAPLPGVSQPRYRGSSQRVRGALVRGRQSRRMPPACFSGTCPLLPESDS
jgi:hypothetical protein